MRASISAFVALCLLAPACGHAPVAGTYTRDADEPWLDQPAMSTGLDRRDLDRMFAVLADDLFTSPFYQRAGGVTPAPSLAIAPMLNETTEHIDAQLDALLSKLETQAVRDGVFAVVSRERQAQLTDELVNQRSDLFDPAFAARYGALVGANYLLVGKVYDSAERTLDMRRVQYMAFLQLVEVETGLVRWQGESDVTKAYVAGR